MPRARRDMVKFSLYVPAGWREDLRTHAEKAGIDVSTLVREIIGRFLQQGGPA